MRLILQRSYMAPTHTRGVLSVGKYFFQTLEEPWKDNAQGQSCIPAGKYLLIPHGWEEDTKFKMKKCWEVSPVKGRVGILIHAGNTTDDIEGCILVGNVAGMLNGKPAVLQSREALTELRKILGNNNHTLEVINGTSL